MTSSFLFMIVVAVGCGRSSSVGPASASTDDAVPISGSVDMDRDGSPAGDDCDDSDATAYPGAVEACTDGVDNDCDGHIDGGDTDCPLQGNVALDDADLVWAGGAEFATDTNGDGGLEGVTSACLEYDGESDQLCVLDEYTIHTQDGGSRTFQSHRRMARLKGPIGDLDGDGVPDFVGDERAETQGEQTRGYWTVTFVRAGPLADWESAPELFAAGSDGGLGLVVVADHDGDGNDDFAYAVSNGGPDDAIYILSSAAEGTVDAESDYLARIVRSASVAGAAGKTLRTADLDADGVADLLAYDADWPEIPYNMASRVLVYALPVSGDLDLDDDATGVIEGVEGTELLDFDVAGDLNGDGYQDVVIGWAAAGDTRPLATVHTGPITGVLEGEAAWADAWCAVYWDDDGGGSMTGQQVRNVGDVDGDGREDWTVAGDLYGEDDVYVSLLLFDDTAAGSLLASEATVGFLGEDGEIRVGGAGDSDGDGRSDLVLTGTSSTDSGLFLFFGR